MTVAAAQDLLTASSRQSIDFFEPPRERSLSMSMTQIILIVALIILIAVYFVIKKKQQG